MKKAHKNVVENTLVTNAPVGKRIGAAAFDFLVMIVTFLLLSFVIRPIMDAAVKIDTLSARYEIHMKESRLVYLDQKLEDNPNLDEVKIVSLKLQPGDFAERTYLFYTEFMYNYVGDETKYTHDWYLENIMMVDQEDSYFTLTPTEEVPLDDTSETSSETPSDTSARIRFSSDVTSDTSDATSEAATGDVPSSEEVDRFLPTGVYMIGGVTVEQLQKFNTAIYNGAIKTFNEIKEHKDLQYYLSVETLINLAISTSIYYLLVPLLAKNGQTLGKMIFKLGVTDLYGFRVKWWQLLIRYFAFFILELLSWYVIPVLGLFISLTLMIFNKKGRALHDFVGFTRVVSLPHSVIFSTIDEYNEEMKRRELEATAPKREYVNEEMPEERLKEDSGA